MSNKPTYEALEQRVRILEKYNFELKQADGALRESEALFRNLFEHHAAVQLIIDPGNGNIIDANDAAVEFYGWTKQQLQQMKIQDINIHPPEEIKQKIEKALTKKQNYFEFHHRLKDGSIRDVEVFSSNIQAKGKDRLHSLVHDITTRKKAEQALRESEGLLSSIYRAAPTGIGVVSNRTLLTVNDRICEMTGYSRESLIGKSARILYPDDADFDFVGREKYRQISESGTGTVETHWQRRDGQVIDVLMSSTPINPQDLAAGVTFTALDITERKQAETELRKSHQMFLTVLEGIDATVYVADMHSHEILFMNKHMIDAFGGDYTSPDPGSAGRGRAVRYLRAGSGRVLPADRTLRIRRDESHRDMRPALERDPRSPFLRRQRDIDSGLERIIMQCLEKKRDDRPASAARDRGATSQPAHRTLVAAACVSMVGFDGDGIIMGRERDSDLGSLATIQAEPALTGSR